MATEFKSHIHDAAIIHGFTNTEPTLSAPYDDIEDAMDAAPECALVWLNCAGTYQFTVCDCKWGMPQILELARGCYELSDLSLVAWRNRGFWETFGE
jgi:hypothetical protein